MNSKKLKKILCDHDFKNAIPYGNVDHFVLSFDVVNCTPKEEIKKMERNLKKHIKDEEKYIQSLK